MSAYVVNNGYFHGAMLLVGRILMLSALAFGLLQCESEIELDFNDFQPKLVINAQISADSGFVVVIGASTTPINPEPGDVPADLVVTLIDLGTDEPIEMYRENDQFLTGPTVTVKPGANYLIEASAPGYEPVQAITTVPENVEVEQVLVENFNIVESEVTPDKKNVSYSLSFEFKNNDASYLHFIFTQHTTITSGGVNPTEELSYRLSPEFPEESGYVKHVDDGILVSIHELESYPIRFKFNDYTIDAVDEVLGELEVEVRTVSPEYYWYFVSLSRQLETLKDPFAEPVPVFTNVDGGLGNFSGYSSKTITLILE